MSGINNLTVGDAVPVLLELIDGNTEMHPQAEIYGGDVLLTTVDLSHVASGLYSYSGYTMPNNSSISVVYVVYTDAPHTTEALYYRDIDIYNRIDTLDDIVEGTLTTRQILRLMASVLLGKTDGGGSATVHFRDTGDAKNRVTATVTSAGNRTEVLLDVTD